jgi:hypothetical protein
MSEFRFFGSETILPGDIALSRYGQIVEMEPAAATALIVASPPALLLPADLWDEIFLPGPETDAELAKWASATIHATVPSADTNAPGEFLARTKAVRDAYHEFRQGLLESVVKAAKDGTLKTTFAEDRKTAPEPKP